MVKAFTPWGVEVNFYTLWCNGQHCKEYPHIFYVSYEIPILLYIHVLWQSRLSCPYWSIIQMQSLKKTLLNLRLSSLTKSGILSAQIPGSCVWICLAGSISRWLLLIDGKHFQIRRKVIFWFYFCNVLVDGWKTFPDR